TVARGALKSGEWVALYSPGGQVFDKPPLTIWLLALSMAVFGSAEWALRLWHILLALATVFITYRLARFTLSVRQSLAAALVLVSAMGAGSRHPGGGADRHFLRAGGSVQRPYRHGAAGAHCRSAPRSGPAEMASVLATAHGGSRPCLLHCRRSVVRGRRPAAGQGIRAHVFPQWRPRDRTILSPCALQS